MAINFCTIGQDPIDGFCGIQRSKILARLIHEVGHDVVPPKPHPPAGGMDIGGAGFWSPFRSQDLPHNVQPVEQPFITVTAEIFGMVGSQTLEASARLDFVLVTDLEINTLPEIAVNISEMEI